MSNSEQLAEVPQPAAVFEQQISQEADRERASILERARRTAEEIRNKASQQVQQSLDAALQKARKQADVQREHLLSKTRLEIRGERLLVQESVFLKALAKVHEHFETKRGSEQHKDLLVGLTLEAVYALRDSDIQIGIAARDREFFEVRCLPEILRRVQKSRMDTLNVVVENLESVDARLSEDTIGVLVRSRDGRLEYDNTVGARMRRMDETLRAIAFEVLLA